MLLPSASQIETFFATKYQKFLHSTKLEYIYGSGHHSFVSGCSKIVRVVAGALAIMRERGWYSPKSLEVILFYIQQGRRRLTGDGQKAIFGKRRDFNQVPPMAGYPPFTCVFPFFQTFMFPKGTIDGELDIGVYGETNHNTALSLNQILQSPSQPIDLFGYRYRDTICGSQNLTPHVLDASFVQELIEKMCDKWPEWKPILIEPLRGLSEELLLKALKDIYVYILTKNSEFLEYLAAEHPTLYEKIENWHVNGVFSDRVPPGSKFVKWKREYGQNDDYTLISTSYVAVQPETGGDFNLSNWFQTHDGPGIVMHQSPFLIQKTLCDMEHLFVEALKTQDIGTFRNALGRLDWLYRNQAPCERGDGAVGDVFVLAMWLARGYVPKFNTDVLTSGFPLAVGLTYFMEHYSDYITVHEPTEEERQAWTNETAEATPWIEIPRGN